MFTGLVEEVGRVLELRRSSSFGRLKVKCSKVLEDVKEGDSVAVNGVCLTVVEIGANHLLFDVSAETLRRTTVGSFKSGDPVNLERALRLSDRLGGHILQGHVDTTTKLMGVKREGNGFVFTFRLPPNFSHLVVEKGSVGIDGISLTVANLFSDSFTVAVIPHTYENTNLKYLRPGELVNVEFDIIGKYVERILKAWKR
ncbi:riboflavin synthase [Phorcysia thermohydrogeniphila]|uniref:Riboflavin synthase n=1 Tax=Phorcysia thermohydrogeniphila TaxID=936138 RepID=A0A4R1GHS0_9BACT|nr:riboflavin synthase [Phorcysia thermohydrogeniphila]TCK05389.1 riboflavin synthase alpha chain [Phorcysia thermohydrogeniphila]